jgi:hypothetical protein
MQGRWWDYLLGNRMDIIKYDLSFEIRIVILVTPKGKKQAINSQGYRRGKLVKINEVFA